MIKDCMPNLKICKKTVAKEMGLPPYVIFQQTSLEDMAFKYPITMDEMENITGVGKNKAQKVWYKIY